MTLNKNIRWNSVLKSKRDKKKMLKEDQILSLQIENFILRKLIIEMYKRYIPEFDGDINKEIDQFIAEAKD
jgi:hypothetical protein